MLDGLTKIKPLAEHLKKNNFSSCAITDHGNLFGILKFYNTMKENGIKPILGSEMYLNHEDSRFPKISNFHLTLLAKDHEGLKNLFKLSSLSFTRDDKKHFYKKPRITFEDLKNYNKGLIAMSGCLAGSLSQLLLRGKSDIALEYIKEKFLPLFGEDFYIEVMRHGIEDEEKVIPGLIELSKETGVPLVATNDSHYIKKEDGPFQNILLALQMKDNFYDEFSRLPQDVSKEEVLKKVSNYSKSLGPSHEFYVKTEEEMLETFKDIPQAVHETEKVANKTNLEIPQRRVWAMPHYELSDEYKGIPRTEGYEKALREICEKNFEMKYSDFSKEEKDSVRTRFEYEFKIIAEKKFAQYFLIVRDIILWAKSHDIPIGPGRGSVVGSVVAYLSDLTSVEPTRYGLLFERFLNPDRSNIPDVDIDVCKRNRDKLIAYIKEKYNGGKEDILSQKVCQIITFNVLQTKAAIRDTGRVLSIPLTAVGEVSKLITNTKESSLEGAISVDPNINQYFEKNGITKLWREAALKLNKVIRNKSIHAAGVVISDKPLVEYAPLYFTKDNEVIAQYEMADIELAHLVKWDILGLKTLTVIADAEKIIRKVVKDFDIEKVPLDDSKTYEMISAGDVQGVFQIESSPGMGILMKNLQPKKMDDLIGGISLYRPGPLNAGLMDDYIRNKKMWEEGRSEEVKKAMNFDLGDILDDAYGTMIYQEHIMRIAQKLSDFSPGDADLLRKAVAKKKGDLILKMKQQFIDGAVKNKNKKADVEKLWHQIEKFAEYAFNKSHSTAYAHLTYWTAYLKANYPVEFFTSLFNNEIDFEKGKVYFENVFQHKIKILPPAINRSYENFTPESGNIRYGFDKIKGVNSKFVTDIVKEKTENGPFKNIFDFIKRVSHKNLNKGTLEILIKVGVFDELHENRAALYDAIENIILYGKKLKDEENNGMGNLFLGAKVNIDIYENLKHLRDLEDFDKNERLRFEKEYLGYYFSSHPLVNMEYFYDIFPLFNSRDIRNVESGYTMGVITDVKKRFTKRNKRPYLILTVEDLLGSVPVSIYSKQYEASTKKEGRDIHDHFNENMYTVAVFKVKKNRDDSGLSCDDYYPVDDLWKIFENRVSFQIAYINIHKLNNNLMLFKQVLEKHKGKATVKFTINDTPAYGQLDLSLSKNFKVKISEELYEEIKSNFDFININFY